jgi:alkylation response protein AidB-like acyl-CoA dehydrogenase
MECELSSEQAAICEAVDRLLAQRAGAERAAELDREGSVDVELSEALAAAGFLEIALADGTGPLEAALVVERVAGAAGVVPIGAQALVAPALLGAGCAGPVAIASLAHAGPVRFAAHARTLLVDAGAEARVVVLAPGEIEAVPSHFMFPLGRVALDASRGESLGAGSGAELRRWWRLAIAAEAAGAMRAALDVTVEYVKRRRQFGRAIGSFQALQHRLARCAVEVEATRWLVFDAAFRGAPAEAAATAAAYATSAAVKVHAETHQLTGAMGFTREHPLHVWSMRLQALRLEAGGTSEHRVAAARERWS